MKQLATFLLLCLPLLSRGQVTVVPQQESRSINTLNPAYLSVALAAPDSLATVTVIAYTTSGSPLRASLQPVVTRPAPLTVAIAYANTASLPSLFDLRVTVNSVVVKIIRVSASKTNVTSTAGIGIASYVAIAGPQGATGAAGATGPVGPIGVLKFNTYALAVAGLVGRTTPARILIANDEVNNGGGFGKYDYDGTTLIEDIL